MKAAYLLGLLMLTASVPTIAGQNQGDVKALITGSGAPLSFQLKDLNSDWRVVTITSSSGMGNILSAAMSMFGGGGAAGDTYYTKGDTEVIGGDTWLITYHAHLATPDFSKMMQGGTPKMPDIPKPTADTSIFLTLINLHTCSGLSDVHPFNLQQELAPSEAAPSTASAPHDTDLTNLKTDALAVIMYAQDHDEVLPPMNSSEVLKHRIMPYLKNAVDLIQPSSGKPYLANHALSGKTLASIDHPTSTVLIYASQPDAAGRRAVAFVDLHVVYVDAAQWTRIKAREHLG